MVFHDFGRTAKMDIIEMLHSPFMLITVVQIPASYLIPSPRCLSIHAINPGRPRARARGPGEELELRSGNPLDRHGNLIGSEARPDGSVPRTLEPLLGKYYSTLCSKATLFQVAIYSLIIIPPFFIAYATNGGYIPISAHYDHDTCWLRPAPTKVLI